MEIWKDIVLEDTSEIRYEISSLGRVRSKNREIAYNGGIRHFKGKILAQNIKENYCRVAIKSKQSTQNALTFLVHRLVANAFIPNPFNHPLVDHIDNNTLNNTLENLRWVSHSENANNRKTYGSDISRVKSVLKFDYDELWVNASEYDSQFLDLGDKFQISNHGRLRYKSIIRNFKEYSYKVPHIDKWCNYPIITFNIKGYKKYKRRVHNVLAKLFVPNPNSNELNCVNHKDGNPINFSITNLEWITYSENNKHAYKVGKKPYMRGEKNGNSNYNEELIKRAYELFYKEFSVRDIAKELSVSRVFLNGVFKGKTWKHLNYPNLSTELTKRSKTPTSGFLITVSQKTYDLILIDLENKELKKDIAIKYGLSKSTLRKVLTKPEKYVK